MPWPDDLLFFFLSFLPPSSPLFLPLPPSFSLPPFLPFPSFAIFKIALKLHRYGGDAKFGNPSMAVDPFIEESLSTITVIQ